jgi:hypothetical protein
VGRNYVREHAVRTEAQPDASCDFKSRTIIAARLIVVLEAVRGGGKANAPTASLTDDRLRYHP